MKKLLYKEIVLCTNVQIILFAAFALFILIPSWPPAVAFIYPLSGLLTLFPRGLANKDIEYTSLLPIKKTDIVKAKALFIGVIELVVVVIATIAALIRFFLYPAPTDPGELAYFNATRPSFSLFGFVFMSFGVMNSILIGMYYKDPYRRLTGPNVISLVVCICLLSIGSLAIAFVPALHEYDMVGLIAQLATLGLGIFLFWLFSFLGYKSGAKGFSNIDL